MAWSFELDFPVCWIELEVTSLIWLKWSVTSAIPLNDFTLWTTDRSVTFAPSPIILQDLILVLHVEINGYILPFMALGILLRTIWWDTRGDAVARTLGCKASSWYFVCDLLHWNGQKRIRLHFSDWFLSCSRLQVGTSTIEPCGVVDKRKYYIAVLAW